MKNYDYRFDPRFVGLMPFEKKIWLSSPTMHGEEQRWVDEAIRTNWVSTVGENINEIGETTSGIHRLQVRSCAVFGTAALHLATKLAGKNFMVRHVQIMEH